MLAYTCAYYLSYAFSEKISSLDSCRKIIMPTADTLPCTNLSTAAHARHASINRSSRDIMYCMQPSSVLVFCKYTRKKLMQEIMDGIYIHAYAYSAHKVYAPAQVVVPAPLEHFLRNQPVTYMQHNTCVQHIPRALTAIIRYMQSSLVPRPSRGTFRVRAWVRGYMQSVYHLHVYMIRA